MPTTELPLNGEAVTAIETWDASVRAGSDEGFDTNPSPCFTVSELPFHATKLMNGVPHTVVAFA